MIKFKEFFPLIWKSSSLSKKTGYLLGKSFFIVFTANKKQALVAFYNIFIQKVPGLVKSNKVVKRGCDALLISSGSNTLLSTDSQNSTSPVVSNIPPDKLKEETRFPLYPQHLTLS